MFIKKGRLMRKLSAIRFKPKPECFDKFVAASKEFSRDTGTANPPTYYIMTCKDEVFHVMIRDSDTINENIENGVSWLDSQRHLLQEYNEIDRHTLPVTGDLVEY
jgi:hypothetical protein